MVGISRRFVCRALPMVAGAAIVGARSASASDFKLVFYNAFPPVSFDSEKGEINGILPDMMKEIFTHRLNMPIALQGMPWARAQASVQDGSADAFCTIVTPARSEYALFTQNSVMSLKLALFYATNNSRRKEIEAISTVEQIKSFTVGSYVGDSLPETVLKGVPVEFTPTIQAVMKKIEAGHNDIFVGTDIVGKGVVKQLGVSEKIQSIPIDIAAPTPFKIGIRKNYFNSVELVRLADDAISHAEKDGALAQIIQKYTA